ncbi:MAG TPA: hypothetical protein VI997_07070 [Candidatus Thermoplasmatota archaeon]|nr:hypothetical protein [Candidatus Thermoplasmatota archaeon]
MRATAVFLSSLLLATALTALAPTASAMAYCVKAGKVEKNNWSEPCGGIICMGYTNQHWTNCVPSPRPPPDPCDLIQCYCTCPPIQSEPALLRLLENVVA